MRIVRLLPFLLALSTAYAHAYQCPPQSSRDLFNAAADVFLVRVVSTQVAGEIEAADGKVYPLMRAHFEVKERFKGEESSEGDLVTNPAGIGTGHVVFIPGIYYVIFAPAEPVYNGLRLVDTCAVPWSGLEGDLGEVEELLRDLRGLTHDG